MPFPQAQGRLFIPSNFCSDFPSEATLTYFKLNFPPLQSPYPFMLVCAHSAVPGLTHSAAIMLQISLLILLIVHHSHAKVLNFERTGYFRSAPLLCPVLGAAHNTLWPLMGYLPNELMDVIWNRVFCIIFSASS